MKQVFDKFWFEKHQRKLIWLANSWMGKYIFQFKKMGHHLKSKVVKITPYSVAELISIRGNSVELKEHFFSRNEYARKLYFILLPLWYAMHFWDWILADRLVPQLSFGFDTLTVNPGSIGARNPVDGMVAYSDVGVSFATIIAAAGNFFDTSSTGDIIDIHCGTTSNQFVELFRSICCFDTSSLTSGASISAAVLSLWGDGKEDGGTAIAPTIDIYTSTPAATNALQNSDYGQIGTISQTGSPITYANWSITGYNDFTFSATGRGNVLKTGISKFGAREAKYDVAASAPTWSSGSHHSFSFKASYNGSLKPKLVVTYTISLGVSQNYLSLLGIGT